MTHPHQTQHQSHPHQGHHNHHKHDSKADLTKKEIDLIDKAVEEAERHQRHHEAELKKEFEEANSADMKRESEKDLYESQWNK